ncbi:hypothetical protein SAMN04487894_10620 [Niabella drilacis]|uniref:Metalloprotease n=2 Tax=Niabella drilacis (strain DSM 25811 / CCM 8410 / CCUG 62505 / LMG 26954 / E90) TaxID=1285928 RepID=A0A1G6RZX8_NIADE|nr:hypothetical protein SAMN04487894_10620 [Niabella drilacis]
MLLSNVHTLYSQGCISYSRKVNDVSNPKPLLTTSGNRTINNVCYTELTNINWMLRIKPRLYFANDGDNGPHYNPDNGNIVLDTNFLNDIIRVYGLAPEKAGFIYGSVIPFLIAHEAAHAKTHSMGWNFNRDRAVKANELFADFCAGMYACLQRMLVNVQSDTRYYGANDISSIIDLFQSLGDDSFTDPQHHATANERKTAVTAGYNYLSDYIFRYQCYYRTNAIPPVDNADVYSNANKMLDGLF